MYKEQHDCQTVGVRDCIECQTLNIQAEANRLDKDESVEIGTVD